VRVLNDFSGITFYKTDKNGPFLFLLVTITIFCISLFMQIPLSKDI